MKLLLLLFVLSLLAVTAFAVTLQKAVIVSYPNDTPDSIVDQAMDTVREAVSNNLAMDAMVWQHEVLTFLQGGIVTHEYSKSSYSP